MNDENIRHSIFHQLDKSGVCERSARVQAIGALPAPLDLQGGGRRHSTQLCLASSMFKASYSTADKNIHDLVSWKRILSWLFTSNSRFKFSNGQYG